LIGAVHLKPARGSASEPYYRLALRYLSNSVVTTGEQSSRLLDESTVPTCPRCRQVLHTLKHWLDCPGTVPARMEIVGNT